ncbi:META domain-containing protein [Palleronia sp. KMU-117]|uniref:META domain-containing protein n=1 Tax=Palleronia sp. KMU-117 TaxID=3434108 RepID=UPI003D74667D
MTPATLAAALLIGVSPATAPEVGPERIYTVQAEVPDLTGTEWQVVELRGQPVEVAPLPEIAFFEDDAFAAWAGCNRFSGGYSRDGATITVPETVAATMMACPPPLDTLEREMIEAMISAKGLAFEGTSLVLTDASGAEVLRLIPKVK